MPPSNTTPATATPILLSQLPYVTTEDVLDGTPQTVYFKITNDLGHDAVVTFWFHGVNVPGNPGVDYISDYDGWEDEAITAQIFNAYPNCATELPILAGDVWWIKVFPFNVGATNPTLNINITLKPYSPTFGDGQVVIFAASADAPFIGWGGLHAGFINPATGIVNFIPFFPAAEQGDVLESGRYLLQDTSGVTQPPATGQDNYVLLYSPNFSLITRVLVPGPAAGFNFQPHIRTNNATDKFWIASSGFGGAKNRYGTVSSAGVISAMTELADFPSGVATVAAHAALNDESYLLVARNSGTSNFAYKWNLNTLAWDGSIGTEVTNYTPSDILVLADNTIIISYYRTADRKDTIIRRYALDGTQLNTMSIATVEAITASPRLGYAKDPLYFWLWMPKVNGVSLLKKVRASDFTLLVDTSVGNVFETAIETPTPQLIYVSDSCPVVETRITPLSGIVVVTTTPYVPGSPRRDTYPDQAKKIPNPTVRTALLGD